jgi:hypothetical protein
MHSCQPELSNEPPPPVAGLELPPAPPEDPRPDDGVTAVGTLGASADGAETARAGCDESSGARATSRASAGPVAELVSFATGALFPCTWRCTTNAVGIAIGAASLRPSGAAALWNEVGRLEPGSPGEEPLPPVTRPSAKQQANTASTATTNIGTRRLMRAVAPRARLVRVSKRIVSRTALMTPGTGSAWDRPARRRHRRALAACRCGSQSSCTCQSLPAWKRGSPTPHPPAASARTGQT